MIMPFELNSYTDEEIFENIIVKVFEQYSEAKWLAADNVAITRENPSGNPGPGWTSNLVSHGLISAPQFNSNVIEINKYVELERMLSSIVFFHLFYDGTDAAYNKLISVQKEIEKLSKENFIKVHTLMRSVAKTNETYNAVIAMLVYSDLGKAPKARVKAEIIKTDFNEKYVDHDDFIDAVLNQPSQVIPHIIPSYFSLSEEIKLIISKVASAMKIHLGHVLHVEGGEKMFLKFKDGVDSNKITPEILDFAFAIQIADVAASAGQVTNKGSLAFTDATCRGYFLVKDALVEITQSVDPKDALQSYIHKRSEWLNLDPQNKDHIMLTRLGCMLRYYHPTEGEHLLKFSQKLTPTDWKSLNKQFDLNSGFNVWQRNPTYIPAVLLNIVKAGGNPIEAAVCLSLLLDQYEAMGNNKSSENPLCFNILAGIASRDPQLFTIEKFDISEFTFNEENTIVQQENLKKVEESTSSSFPSYG